MTAEHQQPLHKIKAGGGLDISRVILKEYEMNIKIEAA